MGAQDFSSHETSKAMDFDPEKKLKVSDVGYRYGTRQGKENRPKSTDAVQKIKKPNETKEKTRLDQSQKLADLMEKQDAQNQEDVITIMIQTGLSLD